MEGEHPKTFGSAFEQSQVKKGGREGRLPTPDVGSESAEDLFLKHVNTGSEILGSPSLVPHSYTHTYTHTFSTYLTSNTFIAPILPLIPSLTTKCITNKNE